VLKVLCIHLHPSRWIASAKSASLSDCLCDLLFVMLLEDTQGVPKDDDNDVVAIPSALIHDHRQTPLHACSIETFPCQTLTHHDEDDYGISLVTYLPLCLGCYQLDQATGTRQGRLDLFAVPVIRERNRFLDHKSRSSAIYSVSSLSDESKYCPPPLTILGEDQQQNLMASGVLDGKWYPRMARSTLHSQQCQPFQNYFATAHANGEILIHYISEDTVDATPVNRHDDAILANPFQAVLAGKTNIFALDENDNRGALCLSLSWEQSFCTDTSSSPLLDTRIISSYSDGCAAVHRIQQTQSTNSQLSISLEHCWPAHSMFTSAVEVWCCAFLDSPGNNNNTTNVVATGGDEGSWKVWDLRTSKRSGPVHHNPNDFQAGVTVLSPHPRHSHLLAVGSYDETVALYDTRYVSSSKKSMELFHSESFNGGIWRCKWHPIQDQRMLVAAMHGGCRIVQFQDNVIRGSMTSTRSNDNDRNARQESLMQVQQEFVKHQSMAYGADWLVYGSDVTGSTGEEEHDEKGKVVIIEAAVSCSFYDQAMYLWDTQSMERSNG
jgi:diphthine methyl ester acylhydrolase